MAEIPVAMYVCMYACLSVTVRSLSATILYAIVCILFR